MKNSKGPIYYLIIAIAGYVSLGIMFYILALFAGLMGLSNSKGASDIFFNIAFFGLVLAVVKFTAFLSTRNTVTPKKRFGVVLVPAILGIIILMSIGPVGSALIRGGLSTELDAVTKSIIFDTKFNIEEKNKIIITVPFTALNSFKTKSFFSVYNLGFVETNLKIADYNRDDCPLIDYSFDEIIDDKGISYTNLGTGVTLPKGRYTASTSLHFNVPLEKKSGCTKAIPLIIKSSRRINIYFSNIFSKTPTKQLLNELELN